MKSEPIVNPRAVLATVALAVFVVSMLQTLVVPALGQIAVALHASTTAVGWVSTVTLLSASVLTPLFGRLGDVHGKRTVLLVSLAITIAGSLLAATTTTLPLLLAGRALQGASFGLFPLAIGILREEYPAEKLTSAMSITSSTLGFGGGLALVATGVLTSNHGDYHRIFWLSLAVSVLAFVVALVVLPARPGHGGQVDFVGALVLGVGLVLLLLPLAQGRIWGWTSFATIGSFVGSLAVLGAFLQLQRRAREPLVAPALLARRAVAVTNVAALAVGFAMFCAFLGISYFVQIPTVAGFGFTASVLATSIVYLLPGTVVSVLVGPIAGRWVVRFGGRLVLAAAGLIGSSGFAFLAVLHSATWQVIVAGTIVNLAVAMAYATLPALIVTNVSPAETGIANSINSIFRSVGSSIGSAIVVTVLSSSANAAGLPSHSAFVAVFVLGSIGFAVVMLTVLFGLPTAKRTLTTLEAEAEIALAEGAEFAGASAAL